MSASKLVGTDLTVALPTAEIALMGPEGAAQIIFKNEIEKAENPEVMRVEKIKQYREQFANPYVAAERGWIDTIIEPQKIRPFLITSLERIKGKEETRPRRRHGTIPL